MECETVKPNHLKMYFLFKKREYSSQLCDRLPDGTSWWHLGNLFFPVSSLSQVSLGFAEWRWGNPGFVGRIQTGRPHTTDFPQMVV